MLRPSPQLLAQRQLARDEAATRAMPHLFAHKLDRMRRSSSGVRPRGLGHEAPFVDIG